MTTEGSSSLLPRLGLECCAATLSALSVAPFISIVDKAIVSNASGLEPLVPCLLNGLRSLASSPLAFASQPSFLLIWGVYSGTYCAANSISAMCEHAGRDATYPKLLGSSATNVSLSVLKDKAFAKMFKAEGSPPVMEVPKVSYALWAMRDSMTVFASFTLPPILHKRFGMDETAAQLTAPCGMQLFSTPLHLYGLDRFNRKEATQGERMAFIGREYFKTAAARIGRIFPAFGVGGVINKRLREEVKKACE